MAYLLSTKKPRCPAPPRPRVHPVPVPSFVLLAAIALPFPKPFPLTPIKPVTGRYLPNDMQLHLARSGRRVSLHWPSSFVRSWTH